MNKQKKKTCLCENVGNIASSSIPVRSDLAAGATVAVVVVVVVVAAR